MRWNQGRAEVDAMLAAGELQRVPASPEHADNLVALAVQHLFSAWFVRSRLYVDAMKTLNGPF